MGVRSRFREMIEQTLGVHPDPQGNYILAHRASGGSYRIRMLHTTWRLEIKLGKKRWARLSGRYYYDTPLGTTGRYLLRRFLPGSSYPSDPIKVPTIPNQG
jgi:hypothetical protein